MKMKKILLIISAVSVFSLAGCYDAGGGARVKIRLGNLPAASNEVHKSFIDKIFSVFVKDAYAQTVSPTDLTVLHIAAVKGNTVLVVKNLTKAEIDTDSTVELTVPPGDDISIVAVGEQMYGYDLYYAGSTMNLNAGEEYAVSLSMGSLQSSLNFVRENSNTDVRWNNIPGAVEYVVYREGIEVYRGKGNICYLDAATNLGIAVHFGYTSITLDYGW